jgi:hypothetical protein
MLERASTEFGSAYQTVPKTFAALQISASMSELDCDRTGSNSPRVPLSPSIRHLQSDRFTTKNILEERHSTMRAPIPHLGSGGLMHGVGHITFGANVVAMFVVRHNGKCVGQLTIRA